MSVNFEQYGPAANPPHGHPDHACGPPVGVMVMFSLNERGECVVDMVGTGGIPAEAVASMLAIAARAHAFGRAADGGGMVAVRGEVIDDGYGR